MGYHAAPSAMPWTSCAPRDSSRPSPDAAPLSWTASNNAPAGFAYEPACAVCDRLPPRPLVRSIVWQAPPRSGDGTYACSPHPQAGDSQRWRAWGDAHLIEQRDRVIHRRDVVVAVGPDRAHGKLEIHLRRDTHGHSGNRAHDALMVAVWADAPES